MRYCLYMEYAFETEEQRETAVAAWENADRSNVVAESVSPEFVGGMRRATLAVGEGGTVPPGEYPSYRVSFYMTDEYEYEQFTWLLYAAAAYEAGGLIAQQGGAYTTED